MFIGINRLMKSQRQLLVLLIAATLALAVLATHSAAGVPHHSGEHGGEAPAQVVLTICLAVLEAGVALTIYLVWFKHRRPSTAVPRPVVGTPAAARTPHGPAPPGRRPALLQVFLR